MRNLIWGQAKETIKRVLGTCSDTVGLSFSNEAQERLLNRAEKPVGSWQRMRVCVGACNTLVWPRQVRTIEAVWLCNQPGMVQTEWHENIGYWQGGWGLTDHDSYQGNKLIDAGTRVSFDNVVSSTTATRKIQAVASNVLDNGKTIHLRYIDGNGSRVYNSTTGAEGETLPLSTTGVLTGSTGTVTGNGLVYAGGLYHVIKQPTVGPVRLYEYDPLTLTQTRLLAVYEPSETVPIYRASTIPWLSNMGPCPTCNSDADNDCTNNKTVTIACKLQHVPFALDNDPLVIGNLAALKLQVKSIKMEEMHEVGLATDYAARAAAELDGELASYLGDGVQVQVRYPDIQTWGMGGVFNPV